MFSERYIKYLQKQLEKGRTEEWLAYRILYDTERTDIQDLAMEILLNSFKPMNLSLTGYDLCCYYFDDNQAKINEFQFVLHCYIDMFIQSMHKTNDKLFCDKVKKYVYTIIGDQLINYYKLGVKNTNYCLQAYQLLQEASNSEKFDYRILYMLLTKQFTKALIGLNRALLVQEQQKLYKYPITIKEQHFFLVEELNKSHIDMMKQSFIKLECL